MIVLRFFSRTQSSYGPLYFVFSAVFNARKFSILCLNATCCFFSSAFISGKWSVKETVTNRNLKDSLLEIDATYSTRNTHQIRQERHSGARSPSKLTTFFLHFSKAENKTRPLPSNFDECLSKKPKTPKRNFTSNRFMGKMLAASSVCMVILLRFLLLFRTKTMLMTKLIQLHRLFFIYTTAELQTQCNFKCQVHRFGCCCWCKPV